MDTARRWGIATGAWRVRGATVLWRALLKWGSRTAHRRRLAERGALARDWRARLRKMAGWHALWTQLDGAHLGRVSLIAGLTWRVTRQL